MHKIIIALTLFMVSCAPAHADEQSDLDTLAKNIYFEQRTSLANNTISDVDAAQVGYVVLNRVMSKHYPDNIQDVVYQRKQFSWTHDGKSDVMTHWYAQQRAYKIASMVMLGTIDNNINGATHYLNKNASRATWWRNMSFRGKHNNHWFYKEIR